MYQLHLDFDGEIIPVNTNWDNGEPISNHIGGLEALPYGDDDTFSSTELAEITAIWELSAESFATFDVNVTTEWPASPTQFTGKNIITRHTAANGRELPHYEVGGIAFLNVFGTNRYAPGVPFSTNISWTRYYGYENVEYLALTIAHEFGHNFNLRHHGQGGDEYYDGHPSSDGFWVPIMGAGDGEILHWTEKVSIIMPPIQGKTTLG